MFGIDTASRRRWWRSWVSKPSTCTSQCGIDHLKFGVQLGRYEHSWEELHGAAPSCSPVAEATACSPGSPETSTPESSKPPATPTAVPPLESQTPFVHSRCRREFGVQLIHNEVICHLPRRRSQAPAATSITTISFASSSANGDARHVADGSRKPNLLEAVEALESFEPRAHPQEDDGKVPHGTGAIKVQAQPIAGSWAEYYLIGRHIDVTQLPADVPLVDSLIASSVPSSGIPACWPCRDVQTDAPGHGFLHAPHADGEEVDPLTFRPLTARHQAVAGRETLIVGGVEDRARRGDADDPRRHAVAPGLGHRRDAQVGDLAADPGREAADRPRPTMMPEHGCTALRRDRGQCRLHGATADPPA